MTIDGQGRIRVVPHLLLGLNRLLNGITGMDFETLARMRAEFDELVRDVRPQLPRYCARMTGSAADGEDIVQEALVPWIRDF
jgi:hypothetical protein